MRHTKRIGPFGRIKICGERRRKLSGFPQMRFLGLRLVPAPVIQFSYMRDIVPQFPPHRYFYLNISCLPCRFIEKCDRLKAMDTLEREKRVLRAEMKKRLSFLRATEREEKSGKIRGLLAAAEFWPSLSALAAFLPLSGEPDLLPLLRQALSEKKALFLPRIAGGDIVFHAVSSLEDNLLPHAYGMPEPSPRLPPADWAAAGEHILFLVPGLAFDHQGGRLGRGKGFYDRFFQNFAGNPSLVLGTAFSRQIVESLPMCGADFPMKGLVCEEGIFIPASRINAHRH
jgi:5-formyltetrahydrofolate cyclo-ligase